MVLELQSAGGGAQQGFDIIREGLLLGFLLLAALPDGHDRVRLAIRQRLLHQGDFWIVRKRLEDSEPSLLVTSEQDQHGSSV